MNASSVFLLVGLGNPGRDYKHNRHNIGFMVVDRLATSLGVGFTRRQARALVTQGRLDGHKTILAKPQTYMNLSGKPTGSLVRFYRIPLENLLVVCDDLDLPLGTLRLRPGGGTAGHKGLESILEHLGSQDFPRLRLGIGRPAGRLDPADFVLRDFSPDEQPVVAAVVDRAAECACAFVHEGIQAAMTRFNAGAE